MTTPKLRSLLALVPALVLWTHTQNTSALDAQEAPKEKAMQVVTVQVHYLEVVTSDQDGTCAALEKLHGIRFGEPEAMLGNARTATLANGGRIGVRAPMAEQEQPVVRPYLLVDDVEAAVEAAQEAGAEIAMPATEIPGHGKFAIYFQGGNQYGLWER